MKKIKTCPTCGKEFETTQNAQKYCCAKCQKQGNRKNEADKDKLMFTCALCGNTFYAVRKRNYCGKECREHAAGMRLESNKKKSKQKPQYSIEEINALAREENSSYGKIVAKYGLY